MLAGCIGSLVFFSARNTGCDSVSTWHCTGRVENASCGETGAISRLGVAISCQHKPASCFHIKLYIFVCLQCPLYLVDDYDSYAGLDAVTLGIAGEKQKLNAVLALELCRIWMQNHKLGEILSVLLILMFISLYMPSKYNTLMHNAYVCIWLRPTFTIHFLSFSSVILCHINSFSL